jgi:PAS domain S-box-containing protein
VSLAISLGFWFQVQHVEKVRLKTLESAHAQSIVERVEVRLKAMEQILRSAAGYLGRGNLPSRDEWRGYLGNLNLPTTYPGIQAISFVEWIPRRDLSAHIRKVRAEGFPDYTVIPGGALASDPDGFSSILYLEPMDARNQRAFGKDMLAEPVRREAMCRARDTGLASLSGRITLYQETQNDVQPGAVLFVPVYQQGMPLDTVVQRRMALHGWASAPLRMTDFISAILSRDLGMADVELFDGPTLDQNRQLFDSDKSQPVTNARPHLVRTLELAGRTWTVLIEPSPAFLAEAGVSHHLGMLMGGLAASFLLFALILTLQGAEGRARYLSNKRGEELLATESKFRALFETAPVGMAIVESTTGRFLSVNRQLGAILGYSMAELQRMTFRDITPPDHLEVDLALIQQLISGAVTEIRKEKRYLHRDGHVVWGRLTIVRLPFTTDQAPIHLSMMEDITEAHRVEEALRTSEQRFKGMFELSPDPITLSRMSDSTLVMANPAWCALTGLTPDEAVEQSPVNLGLWPRPEDREALVREIRETGRLTARETTLRHCDGSERQVLLTAKTMNLDGEAMIMVIGKDVSERHLVLEALKQSAEELAKAQAIGQFGSWRVQYLEDGATWSVSEGLRKIYGYSPDETITFESGFEAMYPADREGVEAAWQASSEGHGPCEWEHRIRVGDEVKWLSVRVKHHFSEEGRLLESSGTVQDISERKEVEASLQASESRLRILGDQLSDSFLYQLKTDAEGGSRFIYVSAGVERLCGLKVEDVQRDASLLLGSMDPQMVPAYLEQEAACERERKPFAMDLRQRRADGEWRWFRVRSTPRMHPDGSLIWEGISTDVTDQKVNQILLEESVARFRGVVENAGDAIFLNDEEGRILLCNRAACVNTGYSMEELLRLRVQDLDPEFVEDKNVQAVHGLVLGQRACIQGRHRRKDGSTFPVEIHISLLRAEEPRQILAVVLDLSQRELVEESLHRARKAESLVLMAGGIAHDFNNLFQAILGYLEIANAKAGENPSLQTTLDRAVETLHKAIALSWKMLDFSGRSFLKLDRLDLATWLPVYLGTLQEGLPPSIQLDVSCESVPIIQGDPSKLEQVVKALVDNACEALMSQGGQIRLRLHTDFGEDRYKPGDGSVWPLGRPDGPTTVCLEMADDGPGVSPEHLERISEPFYTTKELGRGLGLAATAGILRAHRAGLHILNGTPRGFILRMHFPPSGI